MFCNRLYSLQESSWEITAGSLHDGEYEGNRACDRCSIHLWDLEAGTGKSRRMGRDEMGNTTWKARKESSFSWECGGFHLGHELLWKGNVNMEI